MSMPASATVLIENEHDKVVAELDEEGWLSVGVFYKIEDTAAWAADQDAGVVLDPEGVVALKDFLATFTKSKPEIGSTGG